jgi:hypothetical protein
MPLLFDDRVGFQEVSSECLNIRPADMRRRRLGGRGFQFNPD